MPLIATNIWNLGKWTLWLESQVQRRFWSWRPLTTTYVSNFDMTSNFDIVHRRRRNVYNTTAIAEIEHHVRKDLTS
jgi:hypothetical protein